MRLNPSDKILATVKQVVGRNIYGTAKEWENVTKLIIRTENTGKTFVLGQDLVVEIDYIDDEETAQGTALRAPYSRHLWPGDSIEVTPTHFSTNGLAVVNYDGGTVSQVHILDSLPEETANVKIIKICEDIAIAKVVNRVNSEVEVGDRLIVTVESGVSVEELEGGVLNIPMNAKAEIKEKINIRITELGETVRAEIAAPGQLPIHGNELKAKIAQKSSVAEVIGADYDVKLPQPALATGEVRVVVEADESNTQPTASVISYGELLPKIGDTVTATSKEGKSQANPVSGSYSITLDQRTKASAQVEIEITEIDSQVEGKIVDPGVLPRPENVVEGQVERGSTRAVVSGPEYSIKLIQPSLITGTVDIRIESSPDKSDSTGQIISYRGKLPEIGKTIQAVSRAGEKAADPKEGTYRIVLDETVSVATEIEAEINKIDGQVRGKIADSGALPRPGNVVEGQVKRGSTRAVVTGPEYPIELSQPSLITGKVTVVIEPPQDEETVIGRVTSYRGQIPEVWDTIRAVTRTGGAVANPEDGTYEVVIDEITPAAVEVDVWITEVDERIEGEIVDYGRMPLIGREISANVILDKSVANVGDSYRIELDCRSLASGTATVKILSVPDSVHAGTVIGEIVSYGDSLPSQDETVRAKIDNENNIAKPITGRYEIQLLNVGDRHGTGIVKVTAIDECVRGKIVEMDREKSSNSPHNPFNNSKNDLISNKKL